MRMPEHLGNALSSKRMKGAAALFTSRSVNSLVSLFFTLLAGKILLVEDYGQFAQDMARIVIAQAVTEAGLQFSLIRFLAPAYRNGDKNTVADIIRASLITKVLAAGIAGSFITLLIFLILGSSFLGSLGIPTSLLPSSNPLAITHLWLIFLGGFGMSILSYLESVLVSQEKFLRLSLWVPSVGVIRITLLFLFALPGEAPRAEHTVFAFSLGPYIAAASYFLFYPASEFFRPSRRENWQPWIKKLAVYNLWIMAAAFFSILSDWMEIHLITDSSERGMYSAARMPMQGFLILLATMQSLLLPRFSQLERKDEFVAVFRNIYKYILFLAVALLPGFFLGAWFIPWWFGKEYEPAVNVFLLLYPNYILRLLFAPMGTALYALDRPRLVAIEAGLRMGAGLALNLILLPIFGIIGAALASLLAQFAGWIFLLYCFGKYFRTGAMPSFSRKNTIGMQ